MTIEQMRAVLAEKYPSEKWRDKVARMSDSQIVAVYRKLNQISRRF